MVKPNVTLLQGLGHSGRDIRHVLVRVFPKAEPAAGGVAARHQVFVGSHLGDFRTGFPTDYIFASASQDWVFETFELGGKTWEGIALFPDDGDFEVGFADPAQRSVRVRDACEKHYAHRYQIVMRNIVTGEIAVCDPVIGNEDQEHGLP